MKKHEAFQFLVKRRVANQERKLTRKETLSGPAIVEPLDLSSLNKGDNQQNESSSSPSPKRRGYKYSFQHLFPHKAF